VGVGSKVFSALAQKKDRDVTMILDLKMGMRKMGFFVWAGQP